MSVGTSRLTATLQRASPTALATGVVTVVLLAMAAVSQPGLFVDNAIGGLVYGMQLVMVALGLSLILGLMGVVNFAHGALFMLGAYFSFQLVAAWGLPFWVALLVVPIAVGVVGVAMEMTVLRPLYGQEPVIGLLATFVLAGETPPRERSASWVVANLEHHGYRVDHVSTHDNVYGGAFVDSQASLAYRRVGYVRDETLRRDLQLAIQRLTEELSTASKLDSGICFGRDYVVAATPTSIDEAPEGKPRGESQ